MHGASISDRVSLPNICRCGHGVRVCRPPGYGREGAVACSSVLCPESCHFAFCARCGCVLAYGPEWPEGEFELSAQPEG
jgi:hypothetical protein